ncbi:uncharacterized protein at3g27210 [Phtheirospermum japonicum]|uniref:Uncharacterized protein at3g27210 n=1 Tax=Phtheirospermum japonicum TaxID=374723 RepID=A0A830D534_9LAMI|nr:uncharacterized protein at3g27210 [Phtheirospermum japonicum]
MGSCISVHKDPRVGLEAPVFNRAQKRTGFDPVAGQREDRFGQRRGSVRLGMHHSSLSYRPLVFVDAGSKDESFFDSQPWLESDCEDDFVSVNGDFTPSRGNTPVHHSFSSSKPRASNAHPAEGPVVSKPEPSPDKKKRLSELFKESLRDNNYADNQNEAHAKVVPEATGANSRTSSEATPSVELGDEDRSLKSGQCCLPRLILSRSFSERKKKMSPAQKVG